MLSPYKWFADAETPALKREGEIRTHSLILIRWFALFGQLIAIGVVTFGLSFPLPLYQCLFLIGILGLSNLFMAISTGQHNRMSNYHAARLLAFDMVQLSGLFYFTGGLENPFSLTILVPVTIAATLLSRGATTMLTILALFCATFLAFYHEPLPWQGSLLDIHTGRISVLYVTGIWIAVALAAVLMATYLWSLTEEARHTSEALKQTEAALAREQNMSALGGLAAAAAHELGSPLATISVVAKEMMNDLPKDSPIYEDAELLHSQALRCRDILSSLAQQPEHIGGQDYESVSLTDLVEMASKDHLPDTIEAQLIIQEDTTGSEPFIHPSPELLQGLGNLYSNAGQFARTVVRTTVTWQEDGYRILIQDDGPGFPPNLLEHIGEPYLSTRRGENGHMGLGLFIAQTLLQRVGASLRIDNRSGTVGAEISIYFKRNISTENV